MKSYREWMADTLADLKARAASGKTYGDWFELRDLIEDELEWIRKQIRESDDEIRRAHRRCRRWFTRFGERSDLYASWLDRPVALRAIERSYRDELKDGLAEWRRQWKADVETAKRLTKVIDEIKNREHRKGTL
jgi:hypothetical protein